MLVVPRTLSVGLEDLDADVGAHVWAVGHRMARALRASQIPADGINVLLCDGEAAFQTVFHLHLHVIPRIAGDDWVLPSAPSERPRHLLEADAHTLRGVLATLP